MTNSIYRWSSYLVLITILIFGFFKYWLCDLFTYPVSMFLEVVDVNPEELLTKMNQTMIHDKTTRNHLLGWFIYYPAYLCLHLLFIWLLFNKNKKWRNRLMIGLIILVFSLLILIGFSRWLELNLLYTVSFTLFQNLFSLPFILLAIEGGRILWNDIERK